MPGMWIDAHREAAQTTNQNKRSTLLERVYENMARNSKGVIMTIALSEFTFDEVPVVGPSIIASAILHLTITGWKEVELFEGMTPIGVLHNFKIGNLYRDRKARGRKRHQFFMSGKHNKKRPSK